MTFDKNVKIPEQTPAESFEIVSITAAQLLTYPFSFLSLADIVRQKKKATLYIIWAIFVNVPLT